MGESASWINVTPRLEHGLRISNRIDSSKFQLLVNRICQTLRCDVNAKPFSEEEEEKLLVSLDLNRDDLTLLLDGIVLFYKQAACNTVKASALEAVLKNTFKVAEYNVQIFVNAWNMHGQVITDNLRQQSIFPAQVKDISWSLNIQSASSTVKRIVQPIALLKLDLTGDENSNLVVEFDKSELTKLYENLEKVQVQLDALK